MSKKNKTSKTNNSKNSQADNKTNNNLAHECNRENCTCTKNNKSMEL